MDATPSRTVRCGLMRGHNLTVLLGVASTFHFRVNRRNPPFNDRHPASTIPTSWSAKEITKGAKSTTINLPTLA